MQWLMSKNGHRVPVLDGISLCSMMDPIKEAQKWFDSYKDILNDFEHIFVLGIGGGYHVEILLKEVPSALITVIEKNSELILGLKEKIHSWGDRVAVLSHPTLDQIKSYESFHCVFEQAAYCVLSHPISFSNHTDYYKNIEDFILGRNEAGLTYINKIKDRRNAYYSHFQKKHKLTGQETIKDIAKRIQDSDGELTDEDLLWMSLGELIH